jgi:hypothetical protein
MRTRELRSIGRPDRRYFFGGPDARIIMGDDDSASPRLWRDMRPEVERTDLLFGVATKDTSRRWYEVITGRMPIGWHVVAICYATAAIFLGWWPWNFLLLLLLFPIGNKRVRLYAFRETAAKESMRSREPRRRGSSL